MKFDMDTKEGRAEYRKDLQERMYGVDTFNIREALKVIAQASYSTYKDLTDGLPDGDHPEWGYDEQLVKDIHAAVQSWLARQEVK